MKAGNNKRKRLGSTGEKAAIDFLAKNNYKILAKNFRVGRLGEIDIIARQDEYICFIEVKTRSSVLYGTPSEAVNKRKIKNIARLACVYLERHSLNGENVRFDVVEIIAGRGEENFNVKSINLIKNAF